MATTAARTGKNGKPVRPARPDMPPPAPRMIRGLKWLQPGLRVKRWLSLIPVGLFLGILGVMILARLQTLEYLDVLDDLFERLLQRPQPLAEPAFYIPLGLVLLALC